MSAIELGRLETTYRVLQPLSMKMILSSSLMLTGSGKALMTVPATIILKIARTILKPPKNMLRCFGVT